MLSRDIIPRGCTYQPINEDYSKTCKDHWGGSEYNFLWSYTVASMDLSLTSLNAGLV